MASALARAVAAGQLPAVEVPGAWQRITAVPVVLHQLQDAPAVVAMTQRLQRKSAYDASYIVLAERLGAELWTLDGPLARNAGPRGLPVKLIETG
jgi:predicted nucleic acid-binding protein